MNITMPITAFINVRNQFSLTCESGNVPAIMTVVGQGFSGLNNLVVGSAEFERSDYYMVLWSGRWPVDRIAIPTPADPQCFGVFPGGQEMLLNNGDVVAARGWYANVEREDPYTSVVLVPTGRPVGVGVHMYMVSI